MIGISQARQVAIVVAHPDDECLWAGGLLARFGDKCTAICCSIPRADPERAYRFFMACETSGARGRLLPFTESIPPAALSGLDHLDLSDFDLVATHNAQGEYGNEHHRQVHRYLAERHAEKTIFFGFGAPGAKAEVLHLTADEQARRMAALKRYDHISPRDRLPKWQALLERYPIDLCAEAYVTG